MSDCYGAGDGGVKPNRHGSVTKEEQAAGWLEGSRPDVDFTAHRSEYVHFLWAATLRTPHICVLPI